MMKNKIILYSIFALTFLLTACKKEKKANDAEEGSNPQPQTVNTPVNRWVSLGSVAVERNAKTSIAYNEGFPYVAYSTTNGIEVRKIGGNRWEAAFSGGFTVRDEVLNLNLIFNAGIPYVAFSSGGNIILKGFVNGDWRDVGAPISALDTHISIAFNNNIPYIVHLLPEQGGNRAVYVKRLQANQWVSVGAGSLGQGLEVGYSGTKITFVNNIPYVMLRNLNQSRGEVGEVKKFENGAWVSVGGTVASSWVEYSSILRNGNKLYAAYVDGENGMLYTVKEFNGNIWNAVATISSWPYENDPNSLFINKQNLHLLVKEDDKPVVKSLENNAWVNVGGTITTDAVNIAAVATNGSGAIYVAYITGTNLNLAAYGAPALP